MHIVEFVISFSIILWKVLTMSGDADSNPAARLPYSWYNSNEAVPFTTDYKMEGKTYRYFSEHQQENDLLYPFGYGLSYSRFRYLNLDLPLHIHNSESGNAFNLSITLRNLGPFPGTFEIWIAHVILILIYFLNYSQFLFIRNKIMGIDLEVCVLLSIIGHFDNETGTNIMKSL